jgi:VIT1/CCC1 family predicted Fe2+/Mn2+ transporter
MTATSSRILDPSERTAEVLFGLIMVLTFTGSLSMADAGRADIRTMLIGALGCNLAWGLIDGVLYVLGALAERSRDLEVYRSVRSAELPADGRRAILNSMPSIIGIALDSIVVEQIRVRVARMSAAPVRPRLVAADWRGAAAVCLLVFVSTLPVALPFVLMGDAPRALRVSNGIAVAMLFLAGIAYGRAVDRSPLIVGVAMVALGVVLVALTMALGG